MQLTTLVRIPQHYKNLQRMREILGVAIKYGGGDIVARLDLESYLELGKGLLKARQHQSEVVRYTTDERIRMAFEELGPTFIKLGQILATRPDLIPMSLVHELRKLQDKVPTFSPAESKRQIEQELGKPVGEIFEKFEEKPLAAASIAQVHRARLKTGEEVVVKVRRPNLAAIIKTDIDIMQGLAALVEANVPESRQYSPVKMVDEFARSIMKEVDLSHEAFNIMKFARNFEGDPHVHVPRVYMDYTTDKVLTMEFIAGIKASHLEAIEKAGMDRKELAKVGVQFTMEQVFIHGFFHADPHPGNIFVLPGNVIAPIDMGMMGVLDRDMIDNLLELLVGILLQDIDKIIKLFEKLGLVDDTVDRPGLRKDGQELIDRYYNVSLAEVDIAAFIAQLFDVLTRYRVIVPAELLLMGKALATVEGMARDLDPQLDPLEAIRPFILKMYLRRLADPRFLAKDLLRVGRDYVGMAASLPGDLKTIFTDLRRGRLSVGMRAEGLEPLIKEHARSANRLSMSVMIGATTIGAAILLGQESGPSLGGVHLTTLLSLAGFALAGVGYLMVALGFLRSGRF